MATVYAIKSGNLTAADVWSDVAGGAAGPEHVPVSGDWADTDGWTITYSSSIYGINFTNSDGLTPGHLKGAHGTVTIYDVTLYASGFFLVDAGTVGIPSGSTVTVTNGTVQIASGTFTVASGATFTVANSGFYMGSDSTTVYNGGTLAITAGNVNVAGGTLQAQGTINSSGTLNVITGGTLYCMTGGTLTLSGAFTINRNVTCLGGSVLIPSYTPPTAAAKLATSEAIGAATNLFIPPIAIYVMNAVGVLVDATVTSVMYKNGVIQGLGAAGYFSHGTGLYEIVADYTHPGANAGDSLELYVEVTVGGATVAKWYRTTYTPAALAAGTITSATFAAGAITAAAIADSAIDNATFAADVGTTAYASNRIALAANLGADEALNTVIPGSPTANSVNERVAAVDDKLTGITSLPAWLRVMSRVDTANLSATAITEMNTGGGAFAPANDSLEAIVDDIAAIVIGTGGSVSDAVYIDTNHGASGTTVGIDGTPTNPVNNYAEAYIIAGAMGVQKFIFLPDSEITLNNTHEDWIFQGRGLVHLNNKAVSNAYFVDCDLVDGVAAAGSSNMRFDNCVIGAITAGPSVFQGCALSDTVTLDTGTYAFHECFDSDPMSTTAPALSFHANSIVGMRDYSGSIDLQNMVATNILKIDGAGLITVANSSTDGNITVRGFFPPVVLPVGFGTPVTDTQRYGTDQEITLNAATINAIGSIFAGSDVTLVSPLSVDAGTLTILSGDDYTTASGQPIVFVDSGGSWPDLSAGTTQVSLSIRLVSNNNLLVRVFGAVTPGAHQEVTFQITHAQTARMASSAGKPVKFYLQSDISGAYTTLVIGTCTIVNVTRRP